MAELDDKLLKNLDKTLEDMTTHLRGIETALKGVKNGLEATFNPAILKSFSDELRGMKAARLIDAEANVSEVNKIYSAIQEFDRRVKTGTKLEFLSEAQIEKYKQELNEIERRLDAVAGKRLKGEEWLDRKALYDRRDMLRGIVTSDQPAMSVPLSTAELKEAVELLKRYKELYTNITKGEQQRAVELANIKKKEAEESLKQELQLNKEIAAEEKKRQQEAEASAKQRFKEAQDANKAWTQAADAEQKAQAKMRGAQSKQAYKEQANAIQQQIVYQKQLMALRKEYIALNQKKDRTDKESADLERIKTKIKEIINLSKQLNKEQAGTHNIAFKATEYERFRQSIKGATKATKEHNAELNKMLPTLQRLASAFGIAFSIRGLAQFGKKLIETRGEFELQQVALRSILQNKQLADEIWDKTMRAALQSPYTAMQLTKYTKQLAAYRIETEKLFDTTKRLADVSAGLGVDMQRLILAYGQVKAANYLRASEIRQFTEAGVNILGELSQYFTEAKGEMVSTAQVMDMVQKRMVRFEDVAEIFKRMTDQGGIFYNMQYIQSQTVKGQMMKLRDAYDQMLNSIGQGNEGVIKNLVSLLNDIVKNWREWKTVIDLIAWPVIISMLHKFALGLIAVDAAAIKASTGMNTMVVAGARLQLLFKRLWAAIAAHPLFALASALAAVGVALWNHAKAVDGINKSYEDLMLRTYETQKTLSDYSKTLQSNSEIMKTATNGTDEYNKANRENEKIISKLNNDYPELLDGVDLQKDGYDALITKIDAYNKKLEDRIRLEYAARASFGTDDLATNIADLQEAQRKREMEFLENREKAERRYLDLKAQGKEAEEGYWNRRIRLAKNWAEQVDVLEQNKAAMRGGGISLLSQGFVMPGIGGFWGGGVQSRMADLSANIKKESLVYNDIIREQLKAINEDLGDDIEQFIKDNQSEVDKLFKDKEGAGWKLLNERITEFFTAKGVAGSESQQAIQDLLNQFLLIPIQLDWSGNETASNYEPDFELNAANLRKQVNLLEEMKKRYDELSKSAYGYAKSEAKVRQAFKDSFEEIFKGTGITMDMIDFTSMGGLSASIQKALDAATNIKEEVKQEVMKKIDSYEARIEIDAQVRIREDFARQMEDAFGNYELTLELQKLNLPSDVLSDLFDLETVDLSDLRRKVVDFYNERLAVEADPTDLIKQVEGYYKKIDDMERKQQRDRIKDYAKYLEYELSERAKIEMEYTRKSADVAANQAFTSEQNEQIQKRLKEERDKAIAKQEWEDFKSSETYIQMMEDLEHQGTNALIAMRTELERIRENAENLSPRALKEVVNALEKIDEITIKRGMPISNIRNAVAGVRGARVEALESGLSWEQVSSRRAAKQTQADIKAQLLPMEQQFNILQSQLGAEKEIARLEQERYENGLKLGEVFGETFMTGDNEYLQELITNSLTNIESSQERINELTEQRKTASEADTKAIDQKLAEERANLECLKAERDLLEKQLELNIAIAKEALNRAATTEERASLQARINELEEELKKLREQDAAVGNLTKKYGVLGDTVQDAVQKLAGWSQQAVDVFNSFKTMMTSLGVDTDTDAWDDWSTAFETIGTVASTAASMATKIASGDYIGAALDAVKGIMDIVTQWAENNDRELERQIQKQQERIDALKDAYARLEKQIEKTWDTTSYIEDYNKMIKNLNDQIKALEAQRQAEDDKKNTDEDKISDYNKAIQDAEDELEELRQKQIEVFGGLGEVNYRSDAQEFVDAWKEAFLETGDGLQGLQDHFDEFLQEWFVKQATMRVAGRMLEPLFKQIDTAVDESSQGGANVLLSELQRVREKFATIAPQLSDALEQLAGMWGLGDTEGGLSGLAAGIQGMSEEQANILEAYWNSVRMYTASIDMNVSRIAEILGAGVGDRTNPQLQQLESIARNTSAIQSMLSSVIMSGHTKGQSGVRIFVD